MRTLRVIFVAALTVAATVFPTGTASAVAGFGDVPAGAFYTAPVQWAVDNNIVFGKSAECFAPGDAASRGEMAAMLYRMESSPTGSPAHGFNDVTAAWQQAPVSWLKAKGITTGTSATTYSPNRTITRGEVAAMIYRLAGSPASGASAFGDVVKTWQVSAVGWMFSNGITTGTSSTTFSPDRAVTRGELVTFLYRYKGSPPVTVNPLPDWSSPYPIHGTCPSVV